MPWLLGQGMGGKGLISTLDDDHNRNYNNNRGFTEVTVLFSYGVKSRHSNFSALWLEERYTLVNNAFKFPTSSTPMSSKSGSKSFTPPRQEIGSVRVPRYAVVSIFQNWGEVWKDSRNSLTYSSTSLLRW
jgi:hypothetical protein